MTTTTTTTAIPAAAVAKILRRSPAGMFRAIKGLAHAHGGHWVLPDEMPEGSVFSGLDADDHFLEVGPFRADEGFWGISGYGRRMTYTRPDGREVRCIRRPGGQWELGGEGAERPDLREGWNLA